MTKFPNIHSWLTLLVQQTSDGRYEHALAEEVGTARKTVLPQLRALVSEAHEDARRRLRRLAYGSLDPLAQSGSKDPAQGYPEDLHLQTLKGYFGEVLAGVVAENLRPFGMDDWTVPAHLFRFHLVEFQHLEMMKQVAEPAGLRPGRTGDDCLAFRRHDGRIVSALFCEAKCTADHDTDMIAEAHAKSSLHNPLPLDLLQLIEVLEDSTDAAAPQWIVALRRLFLEGATSGYERLDQITYVCGRKPVQKRRWISHEGPHEKYTAPRRLHVAEIHVLNVEQLIGEVYSGKT
jgi:hypothetical protein